MVYKNLVTKAELSRMVGVSQTAIKKALVQFFPEAADGKRIDLHNPMVQRYIDKHAGKKKSTLKSPRKPTAIPTSVPPLTAHGGKSDSSSASEEIPSGGYDEMSTMDADIQALAHRSLRDLVDLFGSAPSFEGWLKSIKLIEDVTEKRIKNEEKLGNLVELDLIKQSVIEPMETCNVQLLTDGMQTLAMQVHAKVTADGTVQQIEDILREHVSSFLKRSKNKIQRAIRNAERTRRESQIARLNREFDD